MEHRPIAPAREAAPAERAAALDLEDLVAMLPALAAHLPDVTLEHLLDRLEGHR